MKIQDLIKNFEEECLFGEDRIRNIMLYDSLLDKICREERMQWNLENIRSYLSIIWYRLKKECPNAERYINGQIESFDVNKTEQIVIKPYEKCGFIAIFNTNLKDKYLDDIYCLFVKNDNNDFVELDSSVARLYPFCSQAELAYLRTNETIDDYLKNKISIIITIIEQNFENKFPSIKLKSKDFNCENLSINICKSKTTVYTKDGHEINPCKDYRMKRIEQILKTAPKIQDKDIEKALKGEKGIAESKLSGWDHIIIDGSDNLPLSLLNMIFNKTYYYINKYQTQVDIIKKPSVYRLLKDIIQRAINRSLKRTSERYYIASTYYIAQNKISYLLPLYISQREKPDCALVFNEENGKYVGNTLYSMDEARTDTRVLGKIDDYKWMI